MSSFPHSLCYLIATYIYCCISATSSPTSSPTLSYTVENECHVTYDTVGASFDLCPLTIKDDKEQLKNYKVADSRNINKTTTYANYHYIYYFNVGDELNSKSIPDLCTAGGIRHQYCPPDTNCSEWKNTINFTDTAWAYQVEYDWHDSPIACWALSNTQNASQWTLLDEEDASLGIQLTYINGDYDDWLCKSNRKFHIRFECEDNIRFIPDEIPLYEYNPCEYTISVPSQYGCPIECNIYDNELCGGHGICGYDNTNSVARCFCFNKYTDDACSTYDETAGIPLSASKTAPDNFYSFTFTNALDTGVNVTYDLRAYTAPESTAAENGGVYIIHDKDYDTSTDQQWTYYVAISELLAPGSAILPDFCENIMGPCMEFNGTQCVDYDESWTGSGLVFQANEETETCYILGRFTEGSPSAELYDQIDDPARGVTIIYGEGSWCEQGHKNREFRVYLTCPRDQSAVYDPKEETTVNILYEYVEEEEPCVYSYSMETAIACPYQCITNGTTDADEHAFTVCSQKGVCAADPEAGFVRCLCDNGWKGVYCTQIDSPQPTEAPTTAPTYERQLEYKNSGYVAITVILVLVIVVVLGIGYVVYRNQKLKISQQEDEIAFHKMTDKGGIIRNVITDQSGKPVFATIDTTQPDANPDTGDNDVR